MVNKGFAMHYSDYLKIMLTSALWGLASRAITDTLRSASNATRHHIVLGPAH